MFDTLLGLPLFQGLGHTDLTRILESTRLEFETVGEGHVLFRQDDLCTGLIFVLQGDVTALTRSADRTWSVEETLPTPTVAGMEVLYGYGRNHRFTLTARGETRLLRMDKRTVGALTAYFDVFRLNILNRLTTNIVRRDQLLWLPAEDGLEGRIRMFLRSHVQHPAGAKRFNISQQTLGDYLGEDKRFVARALGRMQEAGVLQLGRRSIEVPSFEKLLAAKLNPGRVKLFTDNFKK